jgi:hypothetical protein
MCSCLAGSPSLSLVFVCLLLAHWYLTFTSWQRLPLQHVKTSHDHEGFLTHRLNLTHNNLFPHNTPLIIGHSTEPKHSK